MTAQCWVFELQVLATPDHAKRCAALLRGRIQHSDHGSRRSRDGGAEKRHTASVEVLDVRMDWRHQQPLGGRLMRWIYEPDSDHIIHVAEHVRESDEIEVHLSHQLSGRDAVIDSWAYSDIVRGMVTDDGEPCGLCGVVGQRIWMLGTDRLTETRKARWQLCVEGRKMGG